MMKISPFWRHALGATALRMLLAEAGLDAFLEARIEVGTPVTAAERYREAVQLGGLGQSPYAGGIFHGTPLVLAAVQTADWILNTCIGGIASWAGMPSLGMSSVLEAPLRTVMTSAVDIAAACALKSLAVSVVSWLDRKSTASIVSPDTLAALYLWNPLVIAAAVGGSTGGLENAAVFAALAAASRGSAKTAAAALVGASYLGLHPVLLAVPVVLLLWRGPEPLPYESLQLPRHEKLSEELSGSFARDDLPRSREPCATVTPAACGGSAQPTLEQVKDEPDVNEAPVAPQTPDRFAWLGAAAAHALSVQSPEPADAAVPPSETAPSAQHAQHAHHGQHGQQSDETQPFAELSKLRLAKLDAANGKVRTPELPAGCVNHPGAFSAFGSPVETSGPNSPASPQLSPGTTFGSPVDLSDGFSAVRLSDEQRTPEGSSPEIPRRDPDAMATAKILCPGSSDSAAAKNENQAATPQRRHQPGEQSTNGESLVLQERAQHAGGAMSHQHSRQPGSGSTNEKQTVRQAGGSADPHKQQLRDSFNSSFHQRRRRGGAQAAALCVAWLLAIAAALAFLSDMSLRNSSGHQCSGFLWIRPSVRQQCSASRVQSQMDGQIGQTGHTGSDHQQHWSRHVYGTILVLDDLTPNIGLHWYFFAEMFAVFRPLWHFVFAAVAAAAVVPIAIRLPHRPLAVAAVQSCATALMKPYPSVTDIAQYLALLPLLSCQLEGGGFPTAALTAVGALVAALGPPMWHMWVYLGSANANFYYAVTLANGAWQAMVIVSMLAATVRYDRLIAGKSLERW